jgi:hypothetical protein
MGLDPNIPLMAGRPFKTSQQYRAEQLAQKQQEQAIKMQQREQQLQEQHAQLLQQQQELQMNAAKAQAIGNTAYGAAKLFSQMPMEAKIAEYPKVRAQLIQDGLHEDDLPEMYDPSVEKNFLFHAGKAGKFMEEAKKNLQFIDQEINGKKFKTLVDVNALQPGTQFEVPTPPEPGFILGPGQKRYNSKGEVIAEGPPASPSSASHDTVETDKGIFQFNPKTGLYDIRVGGNKPTAPKEERIVQVMGPGGTPIWVRESDAVGKPAAQAPRAVTGAERQSLAYYNRAKEAVDTVSATTNPGELALEDRVAKSGLKNQIGLQYFPNILQNSEQQAYRQAQRAFTEARLRKESGAAIPEHEFENDSRTYFAQPGDKPETIEQKRKARQTVLNGLKFSAGRAYEEYYGQAEQPNGPSAPKTAADYLKSIGH